MNNIKYTWDLTKFCKDIADCEKKLHEIEAELPALSSYKGTLGAPDNLLAFLEKEHQTLNKFYSCLIFAKANLDTHTKSEEYHVLVSKVHSTGNKINSELAFSNPEFKKLGNKYFETLKNDPKFKEWSLYFDSIIFANEHTLDQSAENLIAEITKFTGGYKNVYDNCYFADIKYDDALDSKGVAHHLNSGNIPSFLSNPDRVLRKNVSKSAKKAYENYANLMTQNFIFYLTTITTMAKIRKHKSVLESYLNSYNLDKSVYENVIKYSQENLNIQSEYYAIKKKLLNYETMYSYDLNAPLEKETKKYTFLEGVEIVKKAFSILGKEYTDLIDRAVCERWIDVYPCDSKISGAYTWGTYGQTHIILLNWTGDIHNIFTLAHELGHAIHYYYTEQNQKMQNSDLPIFMAEISSTFNEIILGEYLLQNATNSDEKFVVLNTLIGKMLGTVFAQTKMSVFEDFCYKTIENGGTLSKEILKEKWYECVQKNFEEVIDTSTYNTLTWQNVWHFYNQSYYVWQYALAYMISSYFATNIIKNKDNALDNYFTLLKGTNKFHPAEFLKSLGVNINSKEFYITSFKNFKDLFEKFKKSANEYALIKN